MSDQMLPPEAPSYGELLAQIEQLRADLCTASNSYGMLKSENAKLQAEIERLRGERDRQYDQNCEQIVRIAKLEAEIERLREGFNSELAETQEKLAHIIKIAEELVIKRTTPCIHKLEGALTEHDPRWMDKWTS